MWDGTEKHVPLWQVRHRQTAMQPASFLRPATCDLQTRMCCKTVFPMMRFQGSLGHSFSLFTCQASCGVTASLAGVLHLRLEALSTDRGCNCLGLNGPFFGCQKAALPSPPHLPCAISRAIASTFIAISSILPSKSPFGNGFCGCWLARWVCWAESVRVPAPLKQEAHEIRIPLCSPPPWALPSI